MTSYGQRGTGLTTTASCLALALNYHYGNRVLICDFQGLGSELDTSELSGLNRYLTGLGKPGETVDSTFNYILRMASHGMLSRENLKNYTVPISPNGGLDLTQWSTGGRAINLKEFFSGESAKALKAVLELASNTYDLVIVDLGALDGENLRSFLNMTPMLLLIHVKQDITYVEQLLRETEQNLSWNFVGIVLGRSIKSVKGSASQMKRLTRKNWVGHLPTGREIVHCLSEGGLEPFFRRAQSTKGLDAKWDFIGESIQIASSVLNWTGRHNDRVNFLKGRSRG